MRSGVSRASIQLGLASGGVVVGHALAYLIAHHDPTERHRHLALTGHGSFDVLAIIATIAAATALLAVAIRAARQGPVSSVGGRFLAGLQLPIFAAMEILERGGSVDSALSDRAVRIGLVLQLAIGVALALVVRLFERTVAAVVARLRSIPGMATQAPARPTGRRNPLRSALHGMLRLRAPPRRLASV